MCTIFYRFYLECLLPEIVDSLYGKRMQIDDIREPPHIIEAQHLLKQNQTKNKKKNKSMKKK